MKKFLSIILTLCVLCLLYVPVLAAENESINSTEVDEGQDRAAPITRIYGEYLRIYPVYESNGEYRYLKNCYREYKGAIGATYINQLIRQDVQTELKQALRNHGYEPVGWHVDASLYMNVKQAKYIQYTITDYKGTSSLRQQNASIGSNEFSYTILSPENPSTKYGMSGTAYYVPYGNITTAHKAVGLNVRFEAAE